MAEPLLRDALRLIQDIVIEAKGSPLTRDAVRRVEEVLRRVAAPKVSHPDTGYSQREATILFADLRGFASIADAYPADMVLRVLSRCFGMLTEIIMRHYGTIDKFMGDAVMVIFHANAPVAHDHARRAVLCAVEMQIAMSELRRQHHEDKLPEIYIGIGVNTGSVLAGLIGSDAYRAYTVIGDDVNLAARIEALSLRGQVLMSEATYTHCRDFVQASGPMDVHVKGKANPVRVYEALGIPELGKIIPRQDPRRSPRVSVALEVEYRHVHRKMVSSNSRKGQIRDLSYHGAFVEIGDEGLAMYSEVLLAFDLPELHFRAEGVYARVVSLRTKEQAQLAGLEFTSLSDETSDKIRHYVQTRLQRGVPA